MKALSRLLVALGLVITLSRATADEEDDSCEKSCGSHAALGADCFCTCVRGFHSKSGKTRFWNVSANDCVDIDECKTNASLCEPGGECQNTQGTYVCNCNEGFAQSVRDDRKICTALPCPKLSSINCSDAQDRFCKLATELSGLCTSEVRNQSLDSLNGMQTLMDMLGEIVVYLEDMDKTQRHRRATQLMQMAESLLRFLVVHLPKNSTIFGSSRDIDLSIEIRTNRSESLARLSQNETRMEVDWSAVNKTGKDFNMVGLLTYKNLKSVLTEAEVKGKEWEEVAKSKRAVKPSYRVLSRVASAFVNHNETMSLSTPVTFSFTHPKPNSDPDVKVICAFWEPLNGTGRWSEEGCRRLNSSTSTTTFCQCDHMTSFAVLMAFYDVQDKGLLIITKIGLVVSLICLFLAILTFLFCRVIRGIRTSIHLHLCLALFAGNVTFLMGAGNPSNMIACAIVAGLLHYFFLSVFCWMLLEGVELYLMVVQVFRTHCLKHWHIFLVGYGLPAVVVGISAAANSEGYGGKNCWLARERGFLWSFLAPVAFIIVVNAIVFVITIWKLSEKFADINPDMNRLKKQRVLTITAIAQLCILGLTWVFGLFQFSNCTLVMSYIFTIFNSLQGLFIFILHCLLKQQVRDEYYRWFCKGGFGKVHGSDKYSDFTSIAGSNTLRANKSSSESGV
ncbi:adhesion G protein-coupled receptor E5 isoform X2 [Varanus komodoensis]|uniref:adhesion G protein-coupled receptor E5 isoform X2 n=1 Tax=Varanus komodoensis TaxID=61221 RepID=UPI001CF7DBBA|nr:adhesion G protein-coupled receptor E5 isoform X2 [Varanus komodoensis]